MKPFEKTQFERSTPSRENPEGTTSDPVASVLQRTLIKPLADFSARPSKRFRARLAALGVMCGKQRSFASAQSTEPLQSTQSPQSTQSDLSAELQSIVESIHLGSLIIDDVQDGSDVRRGEPALHCLVGEANAINIGSFAYFQALDRVTKLDLDCETKLALFQLLVEKMSDAHLGQALDMNANLAAQSAAEVIELCRRTRSLKTGAICSMAFGSGFILGAKKRPFEETLEVIAGLGAVLQIHDDLGNLCQEFAGSKAFEDLRNGRPSWIWETAAESATQGDPALLRSLQAFFSEEGSHSRRAWAEWPELSQIQSAGLALAVQVENKWLKKLKLAVELDPDTKNQLQQLYLKVRGSYGHNTNSIEATQHLEVST